MFRRIIFKSTSLRTRITIKRNLTEFINDETFPPEARKLIQDLAKPLAVVGMAVWILKPTFKFVSDLHKSRTESHMHAEDCKTVEETTKLEIEARKSIAYIKEQGNQDIMKIQFHAYLVTRYRMECLDERPRQPSKIKELKEKLRKIFRR